MRDKRGFTLAVVSVVFLLFLAGCNGGGEEPGGAPTTPFLGGTKGLEIGFLEGSPPEEVTDGGGFPFQALQITKLICAMADSNWPLCIRSHC